MSLSENSTLEPSPSEKTTAPAEASGSSSSRPESFGLSLEQVAALLAKEHKALVDKSDPILMVVTILNAWLSEVQKLQARHENGLTRLMTDKTDGYVANVQQALAQLTKGLSSASVEGARNLFEDHAARLASFKQNIFWAAGIVAGSALVNVAVFVLLALRGH